MREWTLEAVRNLYEDRDIFSHLPHEDLRRLRDYLDLLDDEISQMQSAVRKELYRHGLDW